MGMISRGISLAFQFGLLACSVITWHEIATISNISKATWELSAKYLKGEMSKQAPLNEANKVCHAGENVLKLYIPRAYQGCLDWKDRVMFEDR